MKFKDFRLQIMGGPEKGYAVNVQSPTGGATAAFVPPDLPAGEHLLGTILARGSLPARQLRPPLLKSAEPTSDVIGERLFTALFPAKIRELFERSVDQLGPDPESGLRIKLVLNPEDPGVAGLQALPWELMRRPGTSEYLSLSRRLPVVRYLDVPRPVFEAPLPRPFRIVAIASNPESTEQLDLPRELRNLRRAVSKLADVEVVTPRAPTLSALRETLVTSECHAIHFMGHGGIQGKDERFLLFTAEDGHAHPVSGTSLWNTISDRTSVRIVVLNSCESASVPGDAARWDPFAGVAISLVLGGIPAVVAMQYAISDKAALEFSRALYQRLAIGDPVDAAVAEGRQAIHSRSPASIEWATPVLFMHTPTGELFPQEEPASKPTAPERKGTRKERAGVLHEVEINFVGRWKGSWENIVKPDKGEESIEVRRQRGGKIWGHYVDLAEPFIIDFEGEFRYGTLFAKYWARAGEPIMQQGSCCLRLKDNRTLEGYYADFSGCGFYKLKLMDRLSPDRSKRGSPTGRKNRQR